MIYGRTGNNELFRFPRASSIAEVTMHIGGDPAWIECEYKVRDKSGLYEEWVKSFVRPGAFMTIFHAPDFE